jgi:hypothetical protein
LNREGAKAAKRALSVNFFITGYPGNEKISPSWHFFPWRTWRLERSGRLGGTPLDFTDFVLERKSVSQLRTNVPFFGR